MRVLVTNSFHMTAYPIVRSLRRHAEFVAVAHMGEIAGDVALSRYVDAYRPASLPRLVPKGVKLETGANSPMETAYVDRLRSICTELRIDTVLPTSDHEVLVLAKNKELLAAGGIFAAVPDLAALIQVQDKLASVRTAQSCGLPTAATLQAGPDQVVDAVHALGLPVVVKARFSYGGFGVRFARTVDEAVTAHRELAGWAGDPFLQEMIPGNREPSVNSVVTRGGTVPIQFTLRKLRHVHTSFSTAVRVIDEIPEAAAVSAMLTASGMVGFVAVQLKEDARDGVHRLIEANPRFGANFRIIAAIAERHGVDLVKATLDAHRGWWVGAGTVPPGQLGLSVMEDFVAVRTRRRAAAAGAPDLPRMLPWLGTMARQHLSGSVVRDVFWQEKFRDRRAVSSSYRRTFTQDLGGDVDLVSFGDWNG